MKKNGLWVMLWAALLVMFMVGCSTSEGQHSGNGDDEQKQPTITDMNEFIDKYKRVDINEFIESPQEFFDDLEGLTYSGNTDFTDWTLNEEISAAIQPGGWYELDTVIFNMPVEITCVQYYLEEYDLLNVTMRISFDDPEKEFDAANQLCEYMFKVKGDAVSISVNREDATENDLRKAFQTANLSVPFDCRWEYPSLHGSYFVNIGYYSYEVVTYRYTNLVIGN